MGGNTILIVDDEAAQREILDEHLSLAGYQRLHATNGVEVLQVIKEKRPDLILMDIQMPKMDGFDALATIRNKMGITDIPVLLLSNITREHLKVKGLELGADDYITKPFNSAELIARIRAALRRTQRYQQLEGKMQGSLADISLADLLQSMALGNKTAHIHLNDLNSDIYIEAGMLVHARFGNFSGKAALQRIFLLEKGGFSIRFDQLPTGIPKQPHQLTSVLMTILAHVDEANELLGRFKGGQGKITADAPVSKYPSIEAFRAQFPMSMKRLMMLMEGALKQNANTIAAALKEKQLKIIS